MSKEVQQHTCPHCESTYKLLFDLEDTSGFPRLCPFCGSETYDEDSLLKYDDGDDD